MKYRQSFILMRFERKQEARLDCGLIYLGRGILKGRLSLPLSLTCKSQLVPCHYHTHTHAHTHACTHARMHTRTHAHTHTRTPIHVNPHTQTNINKNTNTHSFTQQGCPINLSVSHTTHRHTCYVCFFILKSVRKHTKAHFLELRYVEEKRDSKHTNAQICCLVSLLCALTNRM